MVSPELGLALETRKLELKKSGIPVKTMADLIGRLLAETNGKAQQAQPPQKVAEIRRAVDPEDQAFYADAETALSDPDGRAIAVPAIRMAANAVKRKLKMAAS